MHHTVECMDSKAIYLRMKALYPLLVGRVRQGVRFVRFIFRTER